MPSRVDPALGRRRYQIKDSQTGRRGSGRDQPLHQRRRGAHHLEGGTRRGFILGGIIEQRVGFVRLQACIVLRIHGICHFIVVVAWVGRHGKNITGIDIRHHQGAVAGIQRKLCRCDVKVSDPVDDKVVGGNLSVVQRRDILLGDINISLLTKDKADLLSPDHIIFQHVFKQLFLIVQCVVQNHEYAVRNLCKNLLRIRILILQIQLCHVHPAHGDGIVQILVQADGLLCLPRLIGGVGGVDQRLRKHTPPKQVFHDVALVNLIFLVQLIVGRTLFLQLLQKLCINLFPVL